MKRSLNSILIAFFLAFSGLILTAQNQTPQFYNYSVADHYILMQKVKDNPSVLDQYVIYEQDMKLFIEDMKNNSIEKGLRTDTTQGGKMIIPIVFHIIHNYGAENISEAQIMDAIERLNIDYNKLNTDTIPGEDTYASFNARRANVGVEFRLARIDPNGNCTNGINRIQDPRTEYAYYDLCSDYAWDPKKYLNVYSVAFIYPEGINLPDGAAIGGMSVFPPSNPLTPLFTGGDTLADGVLIRHDGIGAIGTATNLMGQPINALNRTFTHELGHYFNLYHPFQNLKLTLGGLIPAMGSDGCATSGGFLNLTQLNGDEVADTPPVKAPNQNTSLSCIPVGSVNSCTNDVTGYGDEPDMVENYMDYQFGYCQNIFTIGQNERIQATLMLDRRMLWSYENAIATGVWDIDYAPLCAPIADFSHSSSHICAGESITFTDLSHSGAVDSREWHFTGGSPATSTSPNPSVTYSTPGTYEAKLVVYNASGADSIVKQNIITVTSSTDSESGDIFQDFESGFGNWTVVNQEGNTWELTSSSFISGNQAITINNFEGNPSGSYDDIITPSYDLTHINGVARIKFHMAYSPRTVASNALAELISGSSTADTIYDRLQVFVSTDCGKTWTSKYNKSNKQLMTNTTYLTTAFTPEGIQDWREETVLLSGVSNKTNIRLKFRFFNRGGNNIFIDKICTGDCGSSSINEDIVNNMNLNIHPNPITQNSVISFNLIESSNIQFSVYDVIGNLVTEAVSQKFDTGNHQIALDKELFKSSGMYFVKILVNDQIVTKKVVVQ
ncbi:MAG: T9SS type A sorting domain-containing protein [Bacteroidales bacterium]|nr:T9SS type A sorting domain-containing protein [Bacteroidales bacterium]MDY0216461.1 T9SS type A sorting domain-containing protein [Bacteroidales bacterium]